MSSNHARNLRLDVPTLVQLQAASADGQGEAECFVRHAFRAAYDARTEHFAPSLMSLRNDAGDLLAVLGLRPVGAERLFLEQYIDQPIEQLLSAAVAAPIDRGALVEVGNFAVGAAGGGRWLITALTACLYAAGHRWAVFTCGPALRNAFGRLGIELVDLAAADPGRLTAEEFARWGSYYDQQPRVMAAQVQQSHAVLSALFAGECTLNALWSGALQAGRLAA